MEKRKKLAIVASSKSTAEMLESVLNRDGEWEIVGAVSSGAEGESIVEKNLPDAVLLDFILPDMDAFTFVRNIYASGIKCRFLLLSGFEQDKYASRLGGQSIACFVLKIPMSDDLEQRVFKERIRGLLSATASADGGLGFISAAGRARTAGGYDDNFFARTLDEEISRIFMKVGIPANLRGYRFLRESVKIAIEDPSMLDSVVKGLYKAVAEKCGSSAIKVERSMRHAIDMAIRSGKFSNINTVMDIQVYSEGDRVTNSEFIGLVAEKMRMQPFFQ